MLEVEKTRTAAYRPQSDGQVERNNQTIQNMLSFFVNYRRDDWDDHLPLVMGAYRSMVHESTQCTPNLMVLGQETILPINLMVGMPPGMEVTPSCPNEYVEWVRTSMRDAYDFVQTRLQQAAVRQKRCYDLRSGAPRFKRGDWVWRYYLPKAREKLGRGWTGPYLVLDAVTSVNYRIQLGPGERKFVVHVDHLKRYEGEERQSWLEPGDPPAPASESDSAGSSSEDDFPPPLPPEAPSDPIHDQPDLRRGGRIRKPVVRMDL